MIIHMGPTMNGRSVPELTPLLFRSDTFKNLYELIQIIPGLAARSAMKNTRVPTKITLDAYAASHRAVREMKEDGELPGRVKVRSSQYLNNLVEQDHRRVKQRIRPMLGFKRFDRGVNDFRDRVAEKIKKGPYKTGKLGVRKANDDGTVEGGTRSLSPIRDQ